jgi:Zn-dependent protease
VEENETVLDDTPDKLGIETVWLMIIMTTNIPLGNYDYFRTYNAMQSVVQVKVANYWEAIGVIAAHKAGINPHSLRRNRIGNIKRTFAIPANGFAVSSATQTT